MAGQPHDHHHDHDHDHDHVTGDLADPRYRRVLWWALLINATLFIVELAGSDAIYRDPQDPYTRKLLASIPRGWQGTAGD